MRTGLGLPEDAVPADPSPTTTPSRADHPRQDPTLDCRTEPVTQAALPDVLVLGLSHQGPLGIQGCRTSDRGCPFLCPPFLTSKMEGATCQLPPAPAPDLH